MFCGFLSKLNANINKIGINHFLSDVNFHQVGSPTAKTDLWVKFSCIRRGGTTASGDGEVRCSDSCTYAVPL